ncbi:MAG: hypothetical protein IPK60_07805 [Sandaracinaceae bacterium]|nr:hypothetical protein [Sandaracinaceae bacterium]
MTIQLYRRNAFARSTRISRVAFALVLAVCASAIVAPSKAHAEGDRFTIELGGGYAMASGAGLPSRGIGGDLWMTYGLSYSFTLRAFGGVALQGSDHWIQDYGVDVVYVINAFAFVPYAGLGMNVLTHTHNHESINAFGLHGVLGIDFLLSDAVFAGLEVRPTLALTQYFEMPIYIKLGFAFDLD